MKRIAIVIGILVCSYFANAQQELQISQYMFNGLFLNPAYAGSRDALSVVADYRNQWTGWKGAPATTALTVHSPLRNDAIGLGLNVVNDKETRIYFKDNGMLPTASPLLDVSRELTNELEDLKKLYTK
jgi:type IX secretion system PorP/SprF family membrane protein